MTRLEAIKARVESMDAENMAKWIYGQSGDCRHCPMNDKCKMYARIRKYCLGFLEDWLEGEVL